MTQRFFNADLSVLVGVAEVVLCSEDHTPKESQQRFAWYQYLNFYNTLSDTGMNYEIMGDLVMDVLTADSGLKVLCR